ncbi:MAG: class I SAM-dependent methyltransferase [Acidobacteriaceae bacterium]|nr:class I SAM-dependent methyltransferase [Acidobacteriaceae bacterium]
MRSRVLGCGIPISTALLFFALSSYGQQLEDFKTNLAPTAPSPEQAVDRMLEVAHLKPGETVYDLGCGDARILIAAAKRYKVKGVGIEISNRLSQVAAENVKKAGLQQQIRIVHGNFMQTDLSDANVVTLYLATTANDMLRPNLERYLRPKTRVVSYDYPIPGWRPVDTSETEGHQGATHIIYLYEVPNSINKK